VLANQMVADLVGCCGG